MKYVSEKDKEAPKEALKCSLKPLVKAARLQPALMTHYGSDSAINFMQLRSLPISLSPKTVHRLKM